MYTPNIFNKKTMLGTFLDNFSTHENCLKNIKAIIILKNIGKQQATALFKLPFARIKKEETT